MPLLTPDLESFLERHEPGYIAYVQSCIRQKQPVGLELEGYRNNRELVQACLWYVIEQGWVITIVSPQARNEWAQITVPDASDNSLGSNTSQAAWHKPTQIG
jgi:hypothetical protein